MLSWLIILKRFSFKSVVVLFFALIFLCFSGHADAKAKKNAPKTKAKTAQVASRSAGASSRYADIVIDAETGEILHETQSMARRYPASLTKMMTLYLTFQALENRRLRLDTLLPVSVKAANQSPSKLGLRPGQSIQVYDAVLSVITESANDSAMVLAEAIGGSEDGFAQMMVDQSRILGMRDTHFENPNGLPNPNQYTTARDMAVLGHALIYHYPGFYPYFSRQTFSYKGRIHRNHNHLMERYAGMDGIKTGYINASGFNLVASAVQKNRRLIGVIFGGRSAASRDKDMEKLLDATFADIRAGRAASLGQMPLPSKVATSVSGGAVAARMPPVRKAAPPVEQQQQAPTASSQEAAEAGAWGIQVGAFNSIDAAQYYLANVTRLLAPLLGNAEPSLQKVTMTDGTAVYRTRFMGVDQKTARAACSYMIKHGQSCLVVSGP